MTILNILKLLRVKDWVKNILVFFPLIFSGKLTNLTHYPSLIISFMAFCFASSFLYIVNDLKDINSDKFHPIKKYNKPLAAKKISNKLAFLTIIILTIAIFFLIKINIFILNHTLLYLFFGLSYVFFIKKIAYLELFIISFGYLIRLDTGSITIEVVSSKIILLTTFFIALFFINLKRLSEINHKYDINSPYARESLKRYSFIKLNFISLFCILSSSTCLLFFGINKNNYFLLVIPFFLLFTFRYKFISQNSTAGEYPINLIFKDKLLRILSIMIFSYLVIIYQ